MRIIHLSDLHFGAEDTKAVAATADFIRRENPQVVVISGDLSAIGLRSELQIAADWMRSLGAPVVCTPGNHDVPYHEFLPRLFNPFRRYRLSVDRAAHRYWRGLGASIETINTARGLQLRVNWALGAVSAGQRRRAAAAMQTAPPGALRVMVTHHPLIYPIEAPLRGLTHGGRHAERAITEAGADLFLCGHLHTQHVWLAEGETRRALCASSGTLSERLRGEPAGFLVIDINSRTQFTIGMMAVEGGVVRRAREVMFQDGAIAEPEETLAGNPASAPALIAGQAN